ncbi:hypothetical protein AB0910_26810 [Streptomyces sp. NPDC047002]|uniref:hypothetical protein n=1 Tax=Streptomyces sp. NPDC047002 TaxID=3155475 RepID=UPI003453F0E9
MTTAHDTHGSEGWQAGVRRRLGLGRLLPLGSAEDGSWLAERAAAGALRAAGEQATAGAAVLGRLRVGPAEDPAERDGQGEGAAGEGAGPPPPPSALPPGPLAVRAEFEAGHDEPLPAVAERLREALSTCAREALGLRVTRVDLRVTGLRDGDAGENAESGKNAEHAGNAGNAGNGDGKGPDAPGTGAAEKPGPVDPDEVPGVTDVPGVARPTRVLGRAVTESPAGDLRVELATAAGHRPLDVARAVRLALAAQRPGTRSVAVVVTEVGC